MLQLDALELAARLDRLQLIDALERAFRADYRTPPRHHHPIGGEAVAAGTLLLMPAWQEGGMIGVKLVTVFPGNAARAAPTVHATYTLFDAGTGVPIALLDGTELTRRRTAATSALAARFLARPDASRLLMIGTGAMAPHLIASHRRVRPIRSVRIWGRRPERAAALAQTMSDADFDVETTVDLEASVRWADVVSCATLTETSLVRGEWLRCGQHLDLIGAFTPQMREADDAALSRSHIYVDTRSGALVEAGEIVQGIASGAITPADIRGDLHDLTRGSAVARTSADEITLFKSVGSAIEDLAAATLAVRGL